MRHLTVRSRAPFIAPPRQFSSGAAAVEFALILIMLMMLAFPVIDYARAIQANTILINITREGANQASRGSALSPVTSQTIMNSLAATAPPLNMARNGMLFITQIIGRNEGGVVRNVVLRQYRWANGGSFDQDSKVWTCPSYAGDGSCMPSGAPTADVLRDKLGDGDVAYVVEAFYKFDPLLTAGDFGVAALPKNLYAITIF